MNPISTFWFYSYGASLFRLALVAMLVALGAVQLAQAQSTITFRASSSAVFGPTLRAANSATMTSPTIRAVNSATVASAVTFRAANSATVAAPIITYRAASANSSTTQITFRAQNSATTTGATLTITKPTGAVADDVMIASIGVTPSSATVPTPAGWTLLRRVDNAGPTSNSLLVFYKVASAAEPASYNWSTDASYTVGGIQAYYNVDTTNPIDVENGQATASALAHATPSIVTTVDNAMVVTSHTFASSRTWAPPAGMTEAFDRPSGANNATGQSIEGAYVLQFAAGATGAKTATAAGNADAGAAHILALRPNASLIVAKPAAIAANDVIIASIGVSPSTATVPTPAGWTLVRRIDNAGPTSNSLLVFYKVATAAEPASYSWLPVGASFTVGGIQAFTNVDTTTPIDVEDGQATASALAHATPSITTTLPNTMLVASYTFASASSWTNASMTERFDRANSTANATGQTIEGASALQAAAGATGAKTATALANADAGAAHILALRPIPATLTITRPGTVANPVKANDVLIASIGVTPSTATVPTPAGWTLVRRIDNAGPTSNSLLVFYKVAGGAEPATYSWSVTGANYTVGGIQAFYNVDTANPIDVENGQATASALTHATPDVTTTQPYTMLVTSHVFASASSWTAQADMTGSFNRANGTANATGLTIQGARSTVPQSLPGATGTKTATAAANADAGATHILALRQSPSSFTLTITKPITIVANDVIIASIGVTPSTATVPTPAGWTLVRRIDNAGPTSNSLLVFYKVAGSAEPASYGWSVAGASYIVGGIQAFYNVDTANPIDVENGQATASGLTHATPSVTTTGANTMIVTSHAFASASSWTVAGVTERFDRASGTGATGETIIGAQGVQAAVGATGAKTATAAANADAGATHILALRPSAVTITKPTNTAANDVLIASVGVSPSTATVPTPAGWTLVRRIDNAGPTSNSLLVFYKVAGASEPANYTWSATNVTFVVGGIQAFYNVDTASPINVENGQATASALTHATPSVTTTVANARLVTSHVFASASSWSPPTGMTESFDRPNGAASATGLTIEGARSTVLQSLPGATGTKTATVAANADAGATHILALLPSLNLTISKPATVVANDVMVVSIGVTPSSTIVTPPAGWTLVRRLDNAGPTSNSLLVFYRVAGATEPGSYAWGLGTASYGVGGLQAFYNVNTANPIDVEAGRTTPSSLSHATPSITTTAAKTMLVTSHTLASARAWTTIPSGMTASFNQQSVPNNNVTGQSILGSRVLLAVPGATGTKTASVTTNAYADAGVAHILALLPYVPSVTPIGFNACEVTATRCDPASDDYDRIKTKIAGTAFTLDLVALNGAGSLEVGFTNNATVSLDASVGLVPVANLDAANCPTTAVTNIAVGNVIFAGGRATTAGVTVAEAYRDVRVRIVCDATNCPPAGVTRCSADDFAIRPNTLGVPAVTDFDPQTAGVTRTLNNAIAPGGMLHKAGQPFTISATARNAAAAPAVTANYAGSPTAIITSHILPASPATCLNVGGCTVTPGIFTANGGVVTSNTASYNEVGAFNMQLVDGTFSVVDNADSNPTEREIRSAIVGVGRFVPDHFALQSGTVTPACTWGTYMNQPFQVIATIAAQNAANATTWNYDATVYSPAIVNWVAENNNAGINLGARLGGLPATTWTKGLHAVNATTAIFGRSGTPDGPYDVLQLGVQVTDTNDGVTLNGQNMNATTAGDCDAATNCNAAKVGDPSNPSIVRFGRLQLDNASGSELRRLPMPARPQYWNGMGFVTNTKDTCTALNTSQLVLTSPQTGLLSTLTSVEKVDRVNNPTTNLLDRFSINLKAPGAGRRGSVVVTVNPPTGVNLANWWLSGGPNYNAAPVAHAIFGASGGAFRLRSESF